MLSPMKVAEEYTAGSQAPEMKKVIFSHCNGFPARSYQYFLKMLDPKHLRYVPQHGHSAGQQSIKNWGILSQEVLALIRKEHMPYVGIGHSMGAVLILHAYYQRPEAFSHLFLMEPPLFSRSIQLGLGLVHLLGLGTTLIPHARRAKRRRKQWQSRTEALTYFKQKPLFRSFHSESLQDYIRHGLQEMPNGHLSLKFSAAIEHKIFSKVPARLALRPIHIPSYYLYATSHSVTSKKNIRYLTKKLPTTQFIPIQGGHMFPMEAPEKTAHLIRNLLCKNTHINA